MLFMGMFATFVIRSALTFPTDKGNPLLWLACSWLTVSALGILYYGNQILLARSDRQAEQRDASGGLSEAEQVFVAKPTSRRFYVSLVGCLLTLVASGFLMLAGLDGPVVFLVVGALAVLGMLAVLILRIVSRRLPSGDIKIDASGIYDFRVTREPIAWGDIARAEYREVYQQPHIQLWPRASSNVSGPTTGQARWNSTLGFAPISINLAGLTKSKNQILLAFDHFAPPGLRLSETTGTRFKAT